jgi:hypothetical protein
MVFGYSHTNRQSLSSLYLYIKREEKEREKTDRKEFYSLGIGN